MVNLYKYNLKGGQFQSNQVQRNINRTNTGGVEQGDIAYFKENLLTELNKKDERDKAFKRMDVRHVSDPYFKSNPHSKIIIDNNDRLETKLFSSDASGKILINSRNAKIKNLSNCFNLNFNVIK